jgi:putative SOS response-associated peptidase YedK
VCGRYTLATVDPADLRGRFPVADGVDIRRRYNVAPGDEVLAVTTDRAGEPRLELLKWGLVPTWAESPGASGKLINARAETVAERPAFPVRLCLLAVPGPGRRVLRVAQGG